MPTGSPRRLRAPKLSLGGWFLVFVLLLTAGYLALLEATRPDTDGTRLRLEQFQALVDDDRIRSATILDADGVVEGEFELAGGSTGSYHVPYFRDDTRQVVADALVRARVPTSVDQQFFKAIVIPALQYLMPALIIIAVFAYFIVSARMGTGLFAIRSGARRFERSEGAASFADVAGQAAAVEEVREIAQLLARAERFTAVGAQLPKGILLYGPPGCGKTLLARALAGEAGASFFSIAGSDFVELYQGVGAARVRELFKEAREHAPAIIFIDELDALAQYRAAGSAAGTTTATEQEQAANQLLAEMDGFSPLEGIVVIGATNRPDVLDPALLRPGRFDRSIGLELPDLHGRTEILGVHARGRPLAAEVNLTLVADRAVGTTGADLAGIVNEAGLLAGREGSPAISQDHLLRGVERVLEAAERQRRLSLRERSVGRRTLAEDRVTFGDVAGAEEAVEELREIRDYLSAPDRYTGLGARIPRGYLLAGPPGTGKTLIARAVAGEANATFISASATEFVMRYAGEGAARVRDLFAEARSVAPAVLFIDEIDAVGSARGGLGDDERHQTLNQILVELDGFSARAGVVVIAATNRPDVLDPALVRPGRFDRQVTMSLPDADGRRAILRLHATGKPLAGDVDLEGLARMTSGMAGADLANVLNEAALLAARDGSSRIDMAHVEEGVERAALGVGGSRTLSERDKRVTAYHEAGHGLVMLALPGEQPLRKLTIVPRAHAIGSAWSDSDEDRAAHTRSGLMEEMTRLLGGRTAEDLVFGEHSSRSQSDLLRVTEIARRMVAQLGMSERLGAVNLVDFAGGHSEETARLIDSEARALVGQAERTARHLLERDRRALDAVAEALFEAETLRLDEVERLVAQAG